MHSTQIRTDALEMRQTAPAPILERAGDLDWGCFPPAFHVPCEELCFGRELNFCSGYSLLAFF